ncbi:MAG: hypothetical protein HYR85_10650 [Planctomycetes bacterium]|nr:hypothetical protein [Planctomycetota bacterium]
MARDRDWFDQVREFIPILIVIVIGLLSGLKRYFEVQRNRPSGTPKSKDDRPARPVMEEVKKYIDAYEGRDTEEEPAPQPKPMPITDVAPTPPEPVANEAPTATDPWKRPVQTPLRQRTAFVAPARVALRARSPLVRASRTDLRRAIVWKEVLGPPVSLRDDPAA